MYNIKDDPFFVFDKQHEYFEVMIDRPTYITFFIQKRLIKKNKCNFKNELMNLKKRSSLALSEIISVQLRFTINALLKWFYNIYKSRFVETDILTKQ